MIALRYALPSLPKLLHIELADCSNMDVFFIGVEKMTPKKDKAFFPRPFALDKQGNKVA